MTHRRFVLASIMKLSPLFAPLAAGGCMLDAQDPDMLEAEPVAEAQAALSATTVTVRRNNNITSDERCRVPASMVTAVGGTLRQVRIQKGSHLGLCTIDTTNSANAVEIEMTEDGITEHFNETGTTVTDVTVSTISNADGQDGVVKTATTISGAYSGFTQDAYEYKLHASGAQVVYTAPHGRIEKKTAEQVKRLYDNRTTTRDAFWLAGYHTSAGGLHGHLHITSTDISGSSFPKLGELLASPLKHAVSFHGFNNDSIGHEVLVGGAETVKFRKGVAEIVNDYLKALNPSTTLSATHDWVGDYHGDNATNFVNELALGGRGLQIEQSMAIRDSAHADYFAGNENAVADGVKSVYDCLFDTADTTDTVSSKPATVSATGTTYTSGKCPRWIGEINVSSDIGTIQIKARKSSICYGGSAHVDIYKQRADGSWDRLGGGVHSYVNHNDDVCLDEGYEAPDYEPASASTPGVFRVIVRASNLDGTAATAQATIL